MSKPPSIWHEALRMITRSTADAVLVTGDLLLFGNKARIAKSLREARLPAIYPNPLYHDDGALISFGPDVKAAANRLARYVDRILKGANAGDLPVEQAYKHRLLIDLRLAREMKLQVPQDLLGRQHMWQSRPESARAGPGDEPRHIVKSFFYNVLLKYTEPGRGTHNPLVKPVVRPLY